MGFVASFVATVQKAISAIYKKNWFFGSQSRTVLPGKHPSEAPYPLLLVSPAVSLGVPGAPSSQFHLLSNLYGAPSQKLWAKRLFL